MEEKLLPQDIQAEQSVICAMLTSPEAVRKVQDILRPEDFYRPTNRIICEAIYQLVASREAVDIITVVDKLKAMGRLAEVGGPGMVTELANVTLSSALVESHAHIVEEASLRRQLIRRATDIVTMGYDKEKDVDLVLDEAEKSILEVAKHQSATDFVPIQEVVSKSLANIEKAIDSKGQLTGIPTLFPDFDRLTAGLQPSDLIILAARPSMGKSTLALNFAQNIAIRQGKAVAYFSLEMSKEQLVTRILCSEGRLNSQKLKVGKLDDGDLARLLFACDKVSKAKIYLDDASNINALEMRSKCRKLVQAGQLDLIIIDYLQLMQGTSSRRGENRQEELSTISRALKSLARELNVPVIALSQLSRAVEQRPNKRPMLSDLRESGALEQDADIVTFLYRESYYKEDCENPNLTEFIVAKHRNGPLGTVKLVFEPDYTKFESFSEMMPEGM